VYLVKEMEKRSAGKGCRVEGNKYLELEGKGSGLEWGFGAGWGRRCLRQSEACAKTCGGEHEEWTHARGTK